LLATEWRTIQLFHAVFLNEQPAITGFEQAVHQRKQGVRVIGQVHFWQ